MDLKAYWRIHRTAFVSSIWLLKAKEFCCTTYLDMLVCSPLKTPTARNAMLMTMCVS